MARNNTSFPKHIFNKLNKSKLFPDKYSDIENTALLQQKIAVKYLLENPTQRGIVGAHEMGSGKTGIATISTVMDEIGWKRDVVFIAPKSLHDNFIHEFDRIEKKFDIKKKIKFISLNASNMIKQIYKLESEGISYGTNKDEIEGNTALEGKFVIVDEAHRLFNGITNGSKNAMEFYDLVLNTKNIKLLFLTGTLIINRVFELVPCFNMLAGYPLFPENLQEFEDIFIEYVNDPKTKEKIPKIKNTQLFKNRIFGLVSYYGKWVKDPDLANEGKLEVLPLKKHIVNMSTSQYVLYETFREKEREESSGSSSFKRSNQRFDPKFGTSSYRVKSRMTSIFTPIKISYEEQKWYTKNRKNKNIINPEYIEEGAQVINSINKDNKGKSSKDPKNSSIKIDNEDDYIKLLLDEKNSSKYKELSKIIKLYKKGIVIVYCDFVSNVGIERMGKYLEYKDNYEKWDGVTNTKNINGFNRYTIISGKQTIEERDEIKQQVNSEENIYGDIIKVVFIGPAGAEGLSLYGVQAAIAMNPTFNYTRLDQFFHRGIRKGGHDHLPKEMRKLQRHIILADYPEHLNSESKKKEQTTDIYMFSRSLDIYKLNMQFYKLIIESSFDCEVHKQKIKNKKFANRINCMSCAPTNQKLFHKNIFVDISSNYQPCKKSKEEKIKVKEILYDGKKYMFNFDEIYNIFEYKEKLEGYIPMTVNHPNYFDIIELISK